MNVNDPSINGPTYQCPNILLINVTSWSLTANFNKCVFTGRELRMKGMNRIGNLLVPNDNYCKFEDFVMPILDKMVEEQKSEVNVNLWYL